MYVYEARINVSFDTYALTFFCFKKGPEVATQLYPHQKKAITFLLERERENISAGSGVSSLWQHRYNPLSRQTTWFHVVTHNEVCEPPEESKGAILADDVCFHKYFSTRSLSEC